MSEEDSVFQPCNWLPEDDCSGSFGFGVEDDDVKISRILDEAEDEVV